MQNFLAVVICLILGGICYRQAPRRGRNPFAWFVIGVLFGIFGLIALFLLPSKKISRLPTTPKVENPEGPVLKVRNPGDLDKLWYYLDLKNTQYGPMSLNALGNAWKEGKVDQSTYLWNETLEEWKPLNDLLEPS